MSVRSFPMPIWPNRGAGWCRWCGEATESARRTWHTPCVETYKLHTWPAVQTAFVRKRDGERCWDCAQTPGKWLRQGPCYRPGSPDHVGQYWIIQRVPALELEHETPLWSVAHLPPEQRRPFFGPENLRLRCPSCHKAKTAREAAERAALKAANQNNQPAKERAA